MIDSNNLLAQLVSVQHGLLTVSENSEADFSHSICPECTKKLYPELNLPTNESV